MIDDQRRIDVLDRRAPRKAPERSSFASSPSKSDKELIARQSDTLRQLEATIVGVLHRVVTIQFARCVTAP